MLRGLSTVSFYADDLGVMTNPHYLDVLAARSK